MLSKVKLDRKWSYFRHDSRACVAFLALATVPILGVPRSYLWYEFLVKLFEVCLDFIHAEDQGFVFVDELI